MGILRRTFFILSALAAIAGGSPLLADELPEEFVQRKGVVKLQPSGPWAINFAEDKCILTRQFGEDDNRHLIFFEQSYPSDRFGMTMAGPGTRRFARGRWVSIGMLEDVPMKHLTGELYGSVDGIGHAIIMSSVFIGPDLNQSEEAAEDQVLVANINLGQAAKIDRVILKLGSSGLSFETGNMMQPLQAMNICAADLVRAWGLDPEKHINYRPPLWLNDQEIVREIQREYTDKARYRGEQAIFHLRTIVEKDGSVSDCHLRESTETEFLQSNACKEMMRAKFEPALDSTGQPMRSFYATSVTYLMNVR